MNAFPLQLSPRHAADAVRIEWITVPDCVFPRARASVATHTLAAPALSSACAAARAVAPVVRMSSTSSTCLPVTACASETVNAPRRLTRLSCGSRPAWLSVARRRIRVFDARCSRHAGCVLRSSPNALSASARAWLNPRSAYLDRCSGTGTTSISAGASLASSAIAAASILPSPRAAGRSRPYLSA
jgi:hypothetical protein